MPFVLIIAGSLLIVAAVRDKQQVLFFLLANDFTGPNNFIFWLIAILIIGAIGYIPKLKPLSDGFLILVILVLFLKRGTGFFDMFQKSIGITSSSSPNVSAPGSSGSQTSTGGVRNAGATISIGSNNGGFTLPGKTGSGSIGIDIPVKIGL